MSDNSQDRSTSHAKKLDLHYPKNSLDNALNLNNAFQRETASVEQSPEREKGDAGMPGSGSRMVKSDAPTLTPKPSSSTRREPDRQAAYSRVTKESAEERKKIDHAKAVLKEFRARMAQRSPGQETYRDRQQDRGR